MTEMELYELKEKLVELGIDFADNATRSELEEALEEATKEDAAEVVEESEDAAEVVEESEDAAEESEKGSTSKKKKKQKRKVHNKTTEINEPDVVDKK